MFNFLKSLSCHNLCANVNDRSSPNVILFVGQIFTSTNKCKVVCPVTDLNNVKNHPFRINELLKYTIGNALVPEEINGFCALFEYHVKDKNSLTEEEEEEEGGNDNEEKDGGIVRFSMTDGFNIRIVDPKCLVLAKIKKSEEASITKILANSKNDIKIGLDVPFVHSGKLNDKSDTDTDINVKLAKRQDKDQSHSLASFVKKGVKAAGGGAVGSGPGTQPPIGGGEIGSGSGDDEDEDEFENGLDIYHSICVDQEFIKENDIVLLTKSNDIFEVVKLLESDNGATDWSDVHVSFADRIPEAFVWGRMIEIDDYGYGVISVTDRFVSDDNTLYVPNTSIGSLLRVLTTKLLFNKESQLNVKEDQLYMLTSYETVVPFAPKYHIDPQSTQAKRWKLHAASKEYTALYDGILKKVEYYKASILCESVKTGELRNMTMTEIASEAEVGDYITANKTFDMIKSIIPRDTITNVDDIDYDLSYMLCKVIKVIPLCISEVDKSFQPKYSKDISYQVIQYNSSITHKINDDVIIINGESSIRETLTPYKILAIGTDYDILDDYILESLAKDSHLFVANIIEVLENNIYNVKIKGCYTRPSKSYILSNVESDKLQDEVVFEEPNILSKFNDDDDNDVISTDDYQSGILDVGYSKLKQSENLKNSDEAMSESSLGKGPFFTSSKHMPIYKLHIKNKDTNAIYTVLTTSDKFEIEDFMQCFQRAVGEYKSVPGDII